MVFFCSMHSLPVGMNNCRLSAGVTRLMTLGDDLRKMMKKLFAFTICYLRLNNQPASTDAALSVLTTVLSFMEKQNSSHIECEFG